MEVDTAVEHSSSVFTDSRGNEGFATRMIFDKIAHVMNDTGDGDQGLAVLGLLDEVIPVDNRELLQRHTPVELATLLVKLLLLLLEPALVDLVLAESLEVGSKAELLPGPDAPLGRVVLVPDDGVTVVGGEFVMEVVVSFAERDESRNDVVTGTVAVIERLLAKPVGKTVDTEGGLLDDEDTQNGGVNESTNPVAPAEASNESGENKSHEEHALHEVPVLPDNDRVLVQIGDVGTTDALGVLLHDHPAEMAVEETLSNGVRILLGVGISVVSTMTNDKKVSNYTPKLVGDKFVTYSLDHQRAEPSIAPAATAAR